ncbi:MAG: tetratricopeptide repeat protein [Spirochaetes bacterium]|nr:tetratricopeptide repeat protein [Spirochaetota bacterium]
MKRIAAAALVILALCAGCSSTPKKKVVIIEKANQAAEYSKLGDGFFASGAYDSALKFYDQALQANMSIDNLEGIAIAYNSIGRVYLQAGSFDLAGESFLDALMYGKLSGKAAVRAGALINLGELAYARGDRDGATGFFDEAAPLAQNDQRVLAILFHDRGVLIRDGGLPDEAIIEIKKAAQINERLKAWTELSSNYYVLATIEAKRENYAGAVELARKALVADKTAEFSRGIAGDLEALASYNLKSGKPESAYPLYIRSFNVWLTINEVAGVKRCLEAVVKLAAELGNEADLAEYSAKLEKLNASM